MKNELDRTYDLSEYSHARLGLGHTGGHLTTAAWLDFQAGFAAAKDAVSASFDVKVISSLCDHLHLKNLLVHTEAKDIYSFLTNPDLGRHIAAYDAAQCHKICEDQPGILGNDLLIVISGGLSPLAITQQIPKFLPAFMHQVDMQKWSTAPIIINPRGRVALGDHLNAIFKAKLVIMLIGERPGLTTPDSLGIYYTLNAKPGYTDHQRSCISNIHTKGLLPELAAIQLSHACCNLMF